MRNTVRLLIGASVLISVSGCSKFFGNLRRDLDDTEGTQSATVGGMWTEKGYLSDEAENAYSSVGHNERNPASAMNMGAQQGSWITPKDMDDNRRDQARARGDDEDPTSFNNTNAVSPPIRRAYGRATRDSFIDQKPNEGSLWASEGQTNYYLTKNKILAAGDIITITAEPEMVKNVNVEVLRTLNSKERDMELDAAQARLTAKALGQPDPDNKDAVTSSAAAPAKPSTPGGKDDKSASDVSIPTATFSDIDVSKNVGFKAGDQVMAEIVERYPNGNYKIRGTKKVPYRNGYRLISLLGVVQGSDINDDKVVPSGKLYEYRTEVIR